MQLYMLYSYGYKPNKGHGMHFEFAHDDRAQILRKRNQLVNADSTIDLRDFVITVPDGIINKQGTLPTLKLSPKDDTGNDDVLERLDKALEENDNLKNIIAELTGADEGSI